MCYHAVHHIGFFVMEQLNQADISNANLPTGTPTSAKGKALGCTQ